MDKLTSEHRSWLMRQVKAKNTKPEIAVRRLIYAAGFRYRLHVTHLPGKPDIVFLGRRKVIFVHGCFWHGHDGCRYGRLPKEREDFWREKIKNNQARDLRNIIDLETTAWKVLVVWQCELKDCESLLEKLNEFIKKK
ncbi:DNA mismatch endonuclease Vsr [Massilia violaceinigra]|uniref:Very short patch repair endonuclease n=1 Tax=Massilia violaceinigra TaxID=2045208 RepID=A0ABY4A7V4_9BURK|nr:very short patch repair endonuclease [Massilia violaceinigra]UOD30873.1 DNA mismatch endonuclease Vsr [Massilia violaceinigra]